MEVPPPRVPVRSWIDVIEAVLDDPGRTRRAIAMFLALGLVTVLLAVILALPAMLAMALAMMPGSSVLGLVMRALWRRIRGPRRTHMSTTTAQPGAL